MRLIFLLVILLAACPASAQYSFVILGDADQDTAGVGAGPGEQAGYVTTGGGSYPDDALIWKGAAGTEVNLDPGGVYLESRAHGTNGSTQIGWARQGAGGGGHRHASIWAGSAATFNDLNPVGYYNSEAFAIDGEYQIGYASSVTYIYFHAMRWRGSHDLFTDLHPIDKPEYHNSQALDGAGGIQAGYADGSLGTHAAMWAGGYTTFLDLHPAGTVNSVAYATDGTKQGGRAQVGSAFHAFLWESTAASAVDVNPAGKSSSEILDMIPGTQVGSAGGHAYLWKGTAGSALDLHSYVTGGYTASSASGIAADGTIVGTVGFGGPVSYAAMWVPVVAGLPGDYNNNGVVDGADYVLWRNGGPLANEVDTPGTVNAADYTAWRSRFGNTSGSGAGVSTNAAVPEPATVLLLMFAAAAWCLRRGDRT